MGGYRSPYAKLFHWCKNKCGTLVKYGERCSKCYPKKLKPIERIDKDATL